MTKLANKILILSELNKKVKGYNSLDGNIIRIDFTDGTTELRKGPDAAKNGEFNISEVQKLYKKWPIIPNVEKLKEIKKEIDIVNNSLNNALSIASAHNMTQLTKDLSQIIDKNMPKINQAMPTQN
jgi:hypothetical protein